jgi:tetratricopeptide (TPR) repeat protein
VSQGAAVHSLLLNKFDTHIIKPITNQNVYTIIIANNQEMKVNLIQAGETVPFPTKIFNQFKPNQNGQKVIEIPFFTGNDQIELEKIVLESPSDLGFKMTDKIAISVDVNSNKVLIITAKINDVETKIIVENPFLSDGKTVKDKEVRNAMKAFNKDSSENNGFPSKEAYNVLIKAYEKNKDYLSAAELLEEAVERHDLKDQYNNLNLLFGKAGNIDKSQKYAEKAIESSPNNSVFLFNMATRFRYSNPKKSIELLEKAYKINQNSPTICYLLGSLLGGEKGNSLMRNAFNLWQVKLMNDKMEQWDYSWFSSCALDLGEIIVYREITKKEKELKQNEEGFYNVENLMGMAENKSKNKSKNQ